ncbi:glycine--tRNA ligase subunit beta [bacterium]|nr:glycine--tRNA ligase subunit beta [bacterium]
MEFLLEIITEEMPYSHVKAGLSQLEKGLAQKLSGVDVDVENIQSLGTCRRLVVYGELAPQQKDKEEQVVGPPRAAAFTPENQPTSAAKGFARSQGVSVDQLEVINTSKGEYVGLKKVTQGRSTREILTEILPPLITSLSFPKMMRWGEWSVRFSRPVKNILCLLGQKPVPFQVDGVESCEFTYGHKIHFPQKIKVDSFTQYQEVLREKKVMVDPNERKKIILHQIKKRLSSVEGELHPDEPLMEKLVYDVENPYVFLGSFPESYLELPLEVLSTAMKEGQRLFSVVKGKKQKPYFLGVADHDRDPKGLIRQGNERVLKARLDDAQFFWNKDREVSLKERISQLDNILFQEKLGTYQDKIQRIENIAVYLANKVEAKKIKEAVGEAARLCKSDLTTEMVREFSSLQGIMGGLYVRKEGYSSQVWKGIYEHYRPSGLGEDSPSTLCGALLSIADKIDSVVGVLGVGVEVSGSKDPFGLRRSAQGICKIILDKKLSFSFYLLLDKVLRIYGNKLEKSKKEVKDYTLSFFKDRLQYMFEQKGYRYDLVQAVLNSGIENIYHIFLRLESIDKLKDSAQFEPMMLIAKRINNILREHPRYRINPELLEEREERELYTTYQILKENVVPLVEKGNFTKAQRILFRIRNPVDRFFDHVMVMDKDKRLQRNRMALLQDVRNLLMQVADYSQIVIEK